MLPFVPQFKCEYCGQVRDAAVDGNQGIFVPCQCDEAKKNRDRDHYLMMERRKKARRNS